MIARRKNERKINNFIFFFFVIETLKEFQNANAHYNIVYLHIYKCFR